MVFQRFAISSSSLLRKCVSPSREWLITPRRNFVVSTPPREKVSDMECLAFGLFISGSIVATPVWVLCHLKDYGTPE